jgi:hypothetical protein
MLASGSRWGLAVAADATGYLIEGGTGAASASGGPAVSVAVGSVLLRTTLSGGVLRPIGAGTWGIAGWQVAASLSSGAWTAGLSGGGTVAGPLRFHDVAARLAAELGRISLDATAGYRGGDLGDRAWGQARLAVAVAPRIALELGGGRYPADPAGFLRGDFLQAGLRLRIGRGADASAAGRAASRPPFEARPLGSGATEVTISLPGIDGAALAGEWNGWSAEPMEALGGGRWRLVLRLAPGAYRFVVIDSAGRWSLPDGVPRLAG